MIVAIDGPAASGKGTLASRIAAHYELPHLDTGALYRAVARDVLARGHILEDADTAAAMARGLDLGSLSDPALRSSEIAMAASIVAAAPQVRAALFALQRQFGRNPRGAVIEGRDIGTVICPDAEVKLFVTASLQARAQRRHQDLLAAGCGAPLAEVAAKLHARDSLDAGRTAAPFRRADDAHLLDTTDLTIEEAFDAAVALINAAAPELPHRHLHQLSP